MMDEKMLNEQLKELHTIADLDAALAESRERPVLLFKHSLTCPISARAFREFNAYLEQADPRARYNLITVQTAREVSNEAAARLRIEHHSPQAILIRNEREVWNASHFSITVSTLAAAIHGNESGNED